MTVEPSRRSCDADVPGRFRHLHGPFDIIGDVHGCFSELCQLLRALGYRWTEPQDSFSVAAPPGRTAVFVGDLVNRGPDVVGVLRLVMRMVMGMVSGGVALCVAGNHDDQLARALTGRAVERKHRLEASLRQLEAESPAFRLEVAAFLQDLPSHLVLDGGHLVVAHAGLPETFHGRSSPEERDFALNGQPIGEFDEHGLPVRYNWAADYHGAAAVVYGHTPVPQPVWLNNTINIDTGCVYGGRLTALRCPERELVSVPALQVWHPSKRPFLKRPPP